MRLLVTGDLHFRGTNPRSRTDLFQEALTAKLMEVFDLAVQHQAEAIVVPGDVFDSPGVTYSVWTDLACLLQDAPCPVMAVPGNHDLWGHNADSVDRTGYGALARLQLVWDLTREPYETMDQGICLLGAGFDADTDRMLDHYLVPQAARTRSHQVWIKVVHGMALEKTPGFELRHTLLADIASHPDAPDMLLLGHEHTGFGHRWLVRPDGHEMLAINPGALCRLSAHPAELERRVQVALLEVHARDREGALSVDLEFLPLRSARPGHEVLSRAHLEAQAEREDRLNRFLDLLASEGETRFLELTDIVNDVAQREHLPESVVAEALRRLSQAREQLGGVAG
jgi:exonuclease SbcD